MSRLWAKAAALRRRLREFLHRGQLGPSRELELFDFVPTRSVGGR